MAQVNIIARFTARFRRYSLRLRLFLQPLAAMRNTAPAADLKWLPYLAKPTFGKWIANLNEDFTPTRAFFVNHAFTLLNFKLSTFHKPFMYSSKSF